jgi:hypothetical protein
LYPTIPIVIFRRIFCFIKKQMVIPLLQMVILPESLRILAAFFQKKGRRMANLTECPAGCITKKWVFFTLRPDLRAYRAEVVRQFFTPDRLSRCGIPEEEFHRIRVFSPEASHAIKSDLKKIGFIE